MPESAAPVSTQGAAQQPAPPGRLTRTAGGQTRAGSCTTTPARSPTRVAGLLILLYAQKLSVIAALTTQRVLHEDGRTLLRLGSRPIVLPAPLDALVGALAGGRKVPGTSMLSVPSSWLFPGRRPGSPLTEDALGQRLHALGISPRQGRGTALFTLADVPAKILAKTLGIHVKAAIQWQKISGGDWSTYAADVSRRSHAQERALAGDQRADPLPSA